MNNILRFISQHFGPFVRALKLLPFVFFYSTSLAVSDITATQMIQDKLCLFQYNRSVEYCARISDQQKDDDYKPEILAHLAVYTIYRSVISTLPSMIFALFMGTWTDNYIQGRKFLLCLNTLGYMMQFALLLLNAIEFSTDVLYILISYIPSAFTGSWVCAVMAGYSYLSNNSPPKYRIILFTIYHIATVIASQIGTYVGGKLLGKAYAHPNGQLYNYITVFSTSIAGLSIALIWILIVVNEKKKQNEEESDLINNDNNNNNNTEQNILDKYDHQINVRAITNSNDINNNDDYKSQLLRIFDIENVRELIKTCLKSRPNKGRAQIMFLYLSMCCVMMADMGKDGILFPYVEEVFYWNAEQYSTVKSIASLAPVLPMSIAVPILSKKFRVRDVTLGVIGLLSIFSSALVLGTIVSPLGLYLSYAFGSLGGTSSLAIRSLLSKIVTESEIGKVFSLLAVLETVMPVIMSAVYNTVFEFTIKSYPSASFHMAAGIVFIPLSVFIWIDLLLSS